MVADILQVRSSSAAAAHRLCHGSCKCWLCCCSLTHARSGSVCACVAGCAMILRASQELQGRLEKAILECVILQGSSLSP